MIPSGIDIKIVSKTDKTVRRIVAGSLEIKVSKTSFPDT